MKKMNFVIIFVASILGLLSTSTTLYLYCKPSWEDQILSDQLSKAALSEIIQAKRIEVNLPSRKLYFIQGNVILKEYSIEFSGSPKLRIPIGDFRVEVKSLKPSWSNLSIQEQAPSETANNLNDHWIGFLTKSNNMVYGIHGVNHSDNNEKNITHGGIKMETKDVKELFNLVELGEPVRIRYERIEALEQDSRIKLTIYSDPYERQPLSEEKIITFLNKRFPNASIDSEGVAKLLSVGSGSQFVGKVHTIS